MLEVIEGTKLARRQVPGPRLIVIGDDRLDDPYVAACACAAAESPDAIVFELRFTADTELPGLLGEVDAFVLAYGAFESESGVAALAGLAGHPVISSYAGGIRELLALCLVGVEISSPVTAQSVADAIVRYHQTPSENWARAAAEGAVRLASELSWEAVGPRYVPPLQSRPSGPNRRRQVPLQADPP